MESPAALRPLEEAADPIRHLAEYRDTQELATALADVDGAVERALRLLLRGDGAAPEDHRLRALSEDQLPRDEVVASLRSRDRISLELAGALHELATVAERARGGVARPADADAAQRAVARLRREVREAPAVAGGDAKPRGAGAEGREGAAADAPDAAGEAERVRGRRGPRAMEEGEASAVHPAESGRWMAWLGAGVALLFLLGLAWVILRGGGPDVERAVAAFRAGRLDSAAVAFEQVLEEWPGDPSATLYLGRIYRRQGRFQESADVLRQGVREHPADDDIRRELGHLLMDLDQPGPAARQYERALELDPEQMLNWAGVIRALRATGDPRAERLLQDAPPEIQAALTRSGESSPTAPLDTAG